MIGKIFVTGSGCDPVEGKHVKDPYLGPNASLGGCRPDIRRKLQKGDQIFTLSGKVPGVAQFVMGGLEIAEKISAIEAYERFPEQRLRRLPNGQVTGNVIVNAEGKQHELDHHPKDTFDRRIDNYLVGMNSIALLTLEEIAEGRLRTLEILREVFGKKGNSVREIIGRARNMTEKQVYRLRTLLDAVKDSVRQPRPKELLRGLASAARVAG
jgi:hypothetical protein